VRCPFCGHTRDRVVDSRESREASLIRRRRECLSCGRRFTSYERIDEIPYMVVKKNGHREKFERVKVLAGLLKASEKRPVSPAALESIVDRVERFVLDSPDREVPTVEIGRMLLSELKDVDKVAYLRFASVYLEFEDVSEFMREINQLFTRKT
jgi:transcriptional repressor NrdR